MGAEMLTFQPKSYNFKLKSEPYSPIDCPKIPSTVWHPGRKGGKWVVANLVSQSFQRECLLLTYL